MKWTATLTGLVESGQYLVTEIDIRTPSTYSVFTCELKLFV